MPRPRGGGEALAERQYRGNRSRGRDPEENTVIARTRSCFTHRNGAHLRAGSPDGDAEVIKIAARIHINQRSARAE